MTDTLRHLGIVVDNVGDYLQIFKECFNFTVLSDELENGEFISHLLGVQNTQVRVVKLADQKENLIEFIEYLDKNPIDNIISVRSLGITHFALNVSDIDKKISLLRKFDVIPINSPRVNQTGEFRVVYLRFGHSFFVELVERLNVHE